MSIKDFYSKLSDKERKMFYIAVGAVVLSLFDMMFLRPVLSRLSELDSEITEKTNNIKRDVRFLAYKDKIMEEQKEYSVFPTDEKKEPDKILAEFLETVESLASESEVDLIKLNPADVESKKGHILYYATLECSGRLQDMVKFMYKIDTTKNLLRVVKLSMTGKKASAEEVRTTLRLSKLIIDPKTVGNYEFSEDEGGLEDTGDAGAGVPASEQVTGKLTSGENNSRNSASSYSRSSVSAQGATDQATTGGASLERNNTAGSGAGQSGSGEGNASGNSSDGTQTGASGSSENRSGVDGASGGYSPPGSSVDEGQENDIYLGGDSDVTSQSGTGYTGYEPGLTATGRVSGSSSSGAAGRPDAGQNSLPVDDKIEEQKEPQDDNVIKQQFEKTTGQGRVRVKSVETLIKDFFHIKPKEPPQQKELTEEQKKALDKLPDDYYEEKGNLWGRRFGTKK